MWNYVLGAFFFLAGVTHFTNPRGFETMMQGMPLAHLHAAAVFLSGVAEILGGALMAWRPRLGSRLLFALVLAVSPANVNMFLNNTRFNGKTMSPTGHAIRGLAQVALLYSLWCFF